MELSIIEIVFGKITNVKIKFAVALKALQISNVSKNLADVLLMDTSVLTSLNHVPVIKAIHNNVKNLEV